MKKNPDKTDTVDTVSASAQFLGELQSVRTPARAAGLPQSPTSLSLVLCGPWLEVADSEQSDDSNFWAFREKQLQELKGVL